MSGEPSPRPKVYLETTIPSYLAARPSRDPRTLADQQATYDWWQRRGAFDLYTSQAVIDEVSAGDPDAAARRLALLGGLPTLGANPDVTLLVDEILGRSFLPPKAAVDAFHISLAIIGGMDFLLT